MLSKGFQSQMLKFSLCPRPDWVRENWKQKQKKKEKKKPNPKPTDNTSHRTTTFFWNVLYIWCFIQLQEFHNPLCGSKQSKKSNRQSCFAQLVQLLLPAGMCISENATTCSNPSFLNCELSFGARRRKKKWHSQPNQKAEEKIMKAIEQVATFGWMQPQPFLTYTFSLFATVIQEDFSSDTRVLKLRKS